MLIFCQDHPKKNQTCGRKKYHTMLHDMLRRLMYMYCVQYRNYLHNFIPEINCFRTRINDSDQEGKLSTSQYDYSRGWKAVLHTRT